MIRAASTICNARPPLAILRGALRDVQEERRLYLGARSRLTSGGGLVHGGALSGKSAVTLDPFALAYLASASLNPGSGTVFSGGAFNGVSIGAAPTGANKRFIVALCGGTGGTNKQPSGITLDGNAMTLVARGNGGNICTSGIFIREETNAGTTANFAVTMSADTQACGLATYRMTNPVSATPDDTTVDDAGGIVLSLDILTGGKAVGVTQITDGSVGTWTGLTENFDFDIRSGEYFSGASGGVAGTPTTVTSSADGTLESGCSASWH